jgi:uncharacterized membrane protein (DUF2068 family)
LRFREDLGLRIEHRGWVVWYLIVERGLRGLLFAGLGLYGYTFTHRDIGQIVATIENQWGLPGSHTLVQRILTDVLDRISGIGTRGVLLIATGALIYGLIELVESVGLLWRRRWAEYLVVIATGFGIPIEIRELIVKLTPVRAGLLLINVVIVVYLVRQKKLFQLGETASQR